jgi:DsbC/DsbD-like thiol-disulfide interchange protein
MNRIIPLAAVALLAAPALALALAAAPMTSESVVKATAKADKPGDDGKQTVTLTLEIDKGWHVYANPVGLEDLASVQTEVTVAAKAKVNAVKIDYPAGTEIKDKTLGNYRVYEGKVIIPIAVTRAKDDAGPLELTIKLQACNSKTCLLPGEVKVTAP